MNGKPPTPANDGTLSASAGSVIVLAVTLYSRELNGTTPASRLTALSGTSIVIVPPGPFATEHAPAAVSCVAPGYVSW